MGPIGSAEPSLPGPLGSVELRTGGLDTGWGAHSTDS